MCCYSKHCKDGSNSVCVASKLCKDGSNSVYVARILCQDGSNIVSVASVCVAIVNSARMEVTVYLLL